MYATQEIWQEKLLCEEAIEKLLAHCQSNNWSGYEPYDAPNSKFFSLFPFLNTRLPRLVLTQALKRSPINFRPLLFIEKDQNPCAVAIFLSAVLNLADLEKGRHEDAVQHLLERLVALRSPNTPYWCWGYCFPWQGRALLVPKWAPNLVCTTFVANGLLDAYEARHDDQYLSMAASAADYILNELYWEEGDLTGFAYPLRTARAQTHNANFLASALLCRVYKLTGQEKYLAPALKVARFSASKQNPDGSWFYGEAPTQKWIDNFHTGFNLSALQSIRRFAGTSEFDSRLRRGLVFYKQSFFLEGGAVRYYHDRDYPVDSHCVAQAITTLVDCQDFDPENIQLARSVFQWAMKHMWDDSGYFYFRVLRFGKNRISYMRWTQAWMLLAMTILVRNAVDPEKKFFLPI
jgi:hypothetical protein